MMRYVFRWTVPDLYSLRLDEGSWANEKGRPREHLQKYSTKKWDDLVVNNELKGWNELGTKLRKDDASWLLLDFLCSRHLWP